LNSPERSLLAVPTAAVSEMRGKNAARAAPMSALAAFEQILGLKHIRPAQEGLGGDAGTNVLWGVKPLKPAGRSSLGTGEPARRVQGVLVFRHLLRIDGHVPSGYLHRRLCPKQIQFGHQAELVASLDQVIRRLLSLEGGFRECEISRDPRPGPGTRWRPKTPTGSGRRGGPARSQVFFQGPIFETANAPKEVEFPGSDAEIGNRNVRRSGGFHCSKRSAGTRALLPLPTASSFGNSSAR